jgi:RNA-directed DNA polymerase
LSRPRVQIITDLIEYYKELGETYESSTGKIFLGINKKNKEAAAQRETATNSNLFQIISKPETLLLAYRSIKGNKGSMTKGSILPKEEVEKMTPEQRILYLRSFTFPDKISLFDFYIAANLLGKGQYPWGSCSRVYVPKLGVTDKQRPITTLAFMGRIVQKAILIIFELIYEPYFERLNRSFGFRLNKGIHDAINAFTTNSPNGMRIAIEVDVEAAFNRQS